MPITLNHSNIGVQYNTGSNYIIETVKSDLYLRNEIVDTIVRDNIQSAPVTPIVSIQEGSNVYAVESYTYSGSANTADYTRVFPNNTICDILVVGGGGSGSESHGGGGGAGAVIFMKNVTMNGNYTIKVGNGGVCEVTGGANGKGRKGNDTEIFKTNNISNKVVAEGGGGGGQLANANGGSGGSGGGGDAYNLGIGVGGTATPYTPILDGVTGIKYGNNGGNAFGNPGHGGGGGGAGGVGENALAGNNSGNAENERAHGGVGIKAATINSVNYDFKTLFGTNSGGIIETDGFLYFGGGGGNGRWNANSDNEGGNGGLGGGGKGGRGTSAGITDPILNGKGYPGINGTGGGGGGGGDNSPAGGSGGSGIVIIRYLVGTIPTNNLLTEPTVISPVFTETIRTFTHSGGTEAQTTHTITVGQDTICDVLVVGGGGCGGRSGGGGGAVIYTQNVLFPTGTYSIKVGNGGISLKSGNVAPTQGANGNDSEILFNTTTIFRAKGGGFGAANTTDSGGSVTGGTGGSGGGSESTGNNSVVSNANIISTNTLSSSFATLTNQSPNGSTIRGNIGGKGFVVPSVFNYSGGGGGGAGGAGGNGSNSTSGVGGTGINNNITGSDIMYGSGGSGGVFNQVFGGSLVVAGSVSSGGGTGAYNTNSSGAGVAAGATIAGRGGGGGGWTTSGSVQFYASDGGSGIVIIKFKSTTVISEGNPVTHKRLNFAYNSDNLVAWYKFNGDYLDSTGNGHNLTNVGTVIQSTQVIEGQAVEFDSTDYLEFPATINPYTIWNGKGITFSCWVRFTAQETWGSLIFFQTDVSNNTGIGFWIKTTPVGSIVAIYLRVDSTIFQYGDANTPLIANLNVWRHFVLCVGISGKMDVYLDNVRINGTETANIPNLTYNARYINRGRGDLGTWDGQMDDFRIYDRALSAADVSLLYNKTYSAPPNTYTLNFPVPTIADINNNSNIVLRGAYDISLSTTNSSIIPKSGQYIIPPTTFSTPTISIRYNLLNPVLDPIGAQWTYNSSNTNVYHMGNVGIGTKSPEYNLDVRGAIYSSSGGYTQTGLTTWSIASDRRIKENIVKASYEKCLENVKNIELYNFNFKDDCVNTNDKHQLGFIAQEVQQVYPKAVEVGKMILNTNEKIDDLLSLNTTQIDYTLYGAVKNLIEKIEDIDNELGNIERNI